MHVPSELTGPPFPEAGFGPGRPWRGDGVFGRVYVDLPDEIARAAPRWLADEHVPGAELLKKKVYRLGGLVVKLCEAPRLLNHLRAPRALRCAERHFASLPLPSPRPALACAASRRGPSLLVREYLAGLPLPEAWDRAPEAEEHLPAFLAAMDTHGIRHGDLHPANLLWDGERWLLLDVDGVRHALHRPARLRLGRWVRLAARLATDADDARVERLFRRTVELGKGRDRTDWKEVRRGARMLRARRAARDRSRR